MREFGGKVALLALPTMINAVALSDLKPRATDLPPACQQVYTEDIPGCTADDFKSRDCSSACFAGLEGLVQPIRDACGNQGVVGQNLIVAFLANVGPQQICTNFDASHPSGAVYPNGPLPTGPGPWTQYGPGGDHTWSGPGAGHTNWGSRTARPSSPAQATATSVPSVQLSSSMTQTRAPKTTHTSTHISYSGTSTATSVKKTGGSLVYDTSSTPAATTASSTPSDTSLPTNPQSSINDGSGGGSPFDTPGNTATPNTAVQIPFSSALIWTSILRALWVGLR